MSCNAYFECSLLSCSASLFSFPQRFTFHSRLFRALSRVTTVDYELYGSCGSYGLQLSLLPR